MAVPRVKPDGTMHIRLRDGSNLIGKLSDVKQFKVKTSIGELSIPIEKVASFSFSGAKTAKIMLRNGDRITGELVIDKIKLTAPWGEVAIDVKFILQVTSKDLAGGFRTVRRSVIEVGPGGQRIVRYVEELVPINRAAPGWNGGDDPVSVPDGGLAPGDLFPPPPPGAIPGAAAPVFPRASRRGR